MVEFFNKKEEMLEIQLTEYGKHSLSLGQLKPAYYAFFDDDILYNTEYAVTASDGTRITEVQRNIDRRIRYETPNLKVVPTRTGAETRVKRFIQAVSGALTSDNSDPAEETEAFQQQYFTEKISFAAYRIGTGDMTTDKTAAWSIKALKNTIDSVEEYIITNPSSSFATIDNGVITRIPQLNIDIDYQTFFQEGTFSEYAISDYLDPAGTSEIYLSLHEDYLVLDIGEENTVNQKENFEVEVFYEASTTSSVTGQPGPNTLEQMSFVSNTSNTMAVPKPLVNGTGDVEYYFNLYLDDEIPLEIIEEAGITDRSLRVNANRYALNRDLYTTPDEDACP